MSELYYLTEDRIGKSVISEITFDPIPIGKKAEETFYIQNNASDELSVEKLNSYTDGPGEIKVKNYPDSIKGNEVGKITLEAAPISSDQLRGLKAEVTIEASAILSP